MAKLLLVVAAALAGGAIGILHWHESESCGADNINYVEITKNTCMTNWDLEDEVQFESTGHVGDHKGCWERLAYNTDRFISSTVYQNQQDGRCVLSFSGYHSRQNGYVRGYLAMTFPPKSELACGRMMFSPPLRLLRHHTSLSNWSRLVHLFAGPDRVCKGDVTLVAESMGGAMGVMLAWCGNSGRLADVQSPSLPNYTIRTVFTLGSPASAVEPLTNDLREDGCFKGKRILFAHDPIPKAYEPFNVKHPRMDAVVIYPGEKPAVKVFSCDSQRATSNGPYGSKPEEPMTNDTLAEEDLISHSSTTYLDAMRFMNAHGLADVFNELPLNSQPNSSVAAKYLAKSRSES